MFFIGYWLVAGPGSYLYLAGKRRKELSWMIFAASAVAATALTVLVVKLVLRGSPEAHHVSIVRIAGGGPGGGYNAVVHSRIGLYIQRDGYQNVALRTTPRAPSAISRPSPSTRST